jgi:predicted XRE-type DNA-binding protein
MPMADKELLARDAKRDIGAELLQSVREMKAGKGKVSFRFEVPNTTTLAAMTEAEKIVQARRARIKKSTTPAQNGCSTKKKLQITQGSDNVFSDLGFPEAEAQNLLLRSDMVIHIRKVIDKLGITQAEAAKLAGITQPRMNDLMKNRMHKFTIDALVSIVANLGYSMQLKFKKTA